jgi:hypothetical protein
MIEGFYCKRSHKKKIKDFHWLILFHIQFSLNFNKFTKTNIQKSLNNNFRHIGIL